MRSEMTGRRPTLVAAIVFAGIFAAGIAAGLALAMCAPGLGPPGMLFGPGLPVPFGPPQGTQRDPDFVPPPFDRLGLDAEQRRRARPIIDRHREKMEALFAEVLPRVQRLRGEFEAEMRPLLGPEQNRRLDEFLAGRPRPSGSPGVGTVPPPRG